jgi:tetratricopeptide (TPR) repeat protein
MFNLPTNLLPPVEGSASLRPIEPVVQAQTERLWTNWFEFRPFFSWVRALRQIFGSWTTLSNVQSKSCLLENTQQSGLKKVATGLRLLVCLSVLSATILSVSTEPASATAMVSESVVQESNQKVNALFDEAFEATSHGDFVTAEALWSEILVQYPHNAAVWSNRGNARVSQHKLHAALEDYSQSIAIAPNQPDPYLNRGTALEGLHQWDAAIADYNRVLELDPQDSAAFNNRGNAKAGAGDWEAALADYQKAAELDPGFAMAQANYGLALYQLGHTEDSMRRFRNLVRKYPQFADMRAALVAALWNRGQRGEAESQWVSVIGLDSRYRDLDWVRTVRRWPPELTDALAQFLSLQNSG